MIFENRNLLSRIDHYIPYLQGYDHILQIHKGYSDDKKFLVTFQDGRQYLLKMFAMKEFEAKQIEYQVLQKMEMYNVKSSRPIGIGKNQQIDMGYMILSYIEGHDAGEEINKYSDEIQYEIGIQSGQELLKMHQYHAPVNISDWYERKLKKHKHYMDQYRTCGYKLEHDLKIISFIEDNIQLMKNRPNLFQHDDYHVGNLIVKDHQLAGVIDFNRYDWGDPVHEFLKIGLFSSEVSVPFSIGQIKGYYNHKQPDELFWRLYSLYLAMSIFSSIVWILKVKPDELELMLDKLYRVLEDHSYFYNIKPRWYAE